MGSETSMAHCVERWYMVLALDQQALFQERVQLRDRTLHHRSIDENGRHRSKGSQQGEQKVRESIHGRKHQGCEA